MKVSEDVVRLADMVRPDSQRYKEMSRERLLAAYRARNIQYWGKEPLMHQRASTLACLSRNNYLLLLDKGLGKSKVILDVFAYRYFQDQAHHRAIILCPNQTAVQGWMDQIKEHAPWAKGLACPADPNAKREFYRNLDKQSQIVVMDFPSLQTILCDRPKKQGKIQLNASRALEFGQMFSFVGLDEIHGLKDRNSLRFETVMAMTDYAQYVYGATATLFNQDPVEAWAQCLLVDAGETFGTTISAFRHFFCTDKYDPFARGNRVSVFDESRMDLFRRWLRGISIRYLLKECVDMPSLRPVVPELKMTDEQRMFYRKVLKDVREAKKADPEARTNAWQKLRRVMSGFIPMGPGEYVPMAHSPKLEWICSRIQRWNEPVVIFYDFTETVRQVYGRLLGLPLQVRWLWAECKDKQAVLRDWNEEKVDVLVIQNQVGSAALNLQRARRQIFYESPVSAILRSQAEARCHRLGQEQVTYIYDLYFLNTVEQKIMERVEQGMSLHAAVTDGIEDEEEAA